MTNDDDKLRRLREAVERLMASENTEIREDYERSFADTDALKALQAVMEECHG